jgi:hypothetical protein
MNLARLRALEVDARPRDLLGHRGLATPLSVRRSRPSRPPRTGTSRRSTRVGAVLAGRCSHDLSVSDVRTRSSREVPNMGHLTRRPPIDYPAPGSPMLALSPAAGDSR